MPGKYTVHCSWWPQHILQILIKPHLCPAWRVTKSSTALSLLFLLLPDRYSWCVGSCGWNTSFPLFLVCDSCSLFPPTHTQPIHPALTWQKRLRHASRWLRSTVVSLQLWHPSTGQGAAQLCLQSPGSGKKKPITCLKYKWISQSQMSKSHA